MSYNNVSLDNEVYKKLIGLKTCAKYKSLSCVVDELIESKVDKSLLDRITSLEASLNQYKEMVRELQKREHSKI